MTSDGWGLPIPAMGILLRTVSVVVTMWFLIVMRVAPISFSIGWLWLGCLLGLVPTNVLTDTAQFAIGE
jgi:hypothetical protein